MSDKSNKSGKACSPAPVTLDAPPPPPGQLAVMSTKQWPLTDGKELYLKYYFMDGSENKRKAVKDTIVTWSTFANVIFDQTQDKDTAEIRISFKGPGSWSAVGTDARLITNKDEPTMSFGWLADSSEPSAEDKGTILHEFGHALGMMHEHQSPARGESIHLKELAVYEYYRPLLNYNDRLVKTQIIDQYNKYFMPGHLNEEGIDIPVNTVLSDMDKAFITLNYPRKEPAPGGMSVKQALIIAGVSEQAAGTILGYVDKGQYTKAREEFAHYNNRVRELIKVNKSFLANVETSHAVQHGITDTISAVVKNPLFKHVVRIIVNRIFIQHSIPAVTSVPESAERHVMDTIGAMIMNPMFAQAISDINTEFRGVAPESKSSDSPTKN
ncbi:peptidase m12a astacin [Moniliophthora roreri]|nr:peptidase m12a astacin [Moniliophthora roreri]